MADRRSEGHAGHSHQPAARPGIRRAGRFALTVLVCAAAATLTAMVLLWPDGSAGRRDTGQDAPQVTGDVVAVTSTACPEVPEGPDAAVPGGGQRVCGTVTVKLTSGADDGQQIETNLPTGPGAPQVKTGDHLVLIVTEGTASGVDYQILDHQRGTQLWALGIAFALAVVAFGRWRGLAALGGLAVTFGVLLSFIVPAILDGRSPLLVAVVGSAAIMLSVLYLTHGFTVPTSVAVLGTLTSLALTGVLAAAATAALHLTGVGTEETNFLSIMFTDVNMQGLLLAGILIGSLGVLDDPITTALAAVAARRTPDRMAAADKPDRRHRRRASFAAEVRRGGWLDPALEPEPGQERLGAAPTSGRRARTLRRRRHGRPGVRRALVTT